MNKVTKKAKSVIMVIERYFVERVKAKYNCPACKTIYTLLSGFPDETTRFKCNCGQELIVNRVKGDVEI